MKVTSSFKISSGVAAAALLALAANSAHAVPINGQVGFGGVVSFNTGNIGTATAITGYTGWTLAGTGDYSSIPAGILTAFTPFSFNPSNTPVTPLWIFSWGGAVYSFDLSTVSIDEQDSDSLVLTGTGTVNISGGTFDPTPATWVLSADNSGGTLNFFSSDTTAVPDNGATVMLLGASLVGLGFARRRLA